MKFTWHFEHGEKTQEFLPRGLSVTTTDVDYTQIVNNDTGATHRFETSKIRLTRRGVVLWESPGPVEAHKLGQLVGITLEGVRGLPRIALTRVPAGVRAELGDGTVIMVPRNGDPQVESGSSEAKARRFMKWLGDDNGGWGWVCDLM